MSISFNPDLRFADGIHVRRQLIIILFMRQWSVWPHPLTDGWQEEVGPLARSRCVCRV